MTTESLPDFNLRQLAIRPLAETSTLPASWYVHPGFESLERRRIFDRHWHLVGHRGEFLENGDCRPVRIGGQSLFVVRDGDTLRAFHNVCRHRAGPLVAEAGRCEVLQCRYHGWRYGLDGRLVDIGDFGEPHGFEPNQIRLGEVSVASWNGLLFCHLSRRPPPLEDWLDGIAQRVAPVDFASYRHRAHVEYAVACNWKTYVDNYLEGYHVPFVHPSLQQQLAYDRYRTRLTRTYSEQSSPLEQAMTLSGRAEGEAIYLYVFPHLMLNVVPGRLQTNRVVPTGPEQCRVEFDYFYDPSIAAADQEADQAASHRTQLEDMAICEQVQVNLASSAYRTGRISPRWETALKDFHDRIRTAFAK